MAEKFEFKYKENDNINRAEIERLRSLPKEEFDRLFKETIEKEKEKLEKIKQNKNK